MHPQKYEKCDSGGENDAAGHTPDRASAPRIAFRSGNHTAYIQSSSEKSCGIDGRRKVSAAGELRVKLPVIHQHRAHTQTLADL